MPIFNLFSKRQKKLRGEVPDVYVYEEIPQKFRVQVVHIIRDAIGVECSYNVATNYAYQEIHKILCREYGVFTLKQNETSNSDAVFKYFLESKDYEQCLDLIELSFRVIDQHVRDNELNFRQATGRAITPDEAIVELNGRFKESGVGYQFESSELVRVDSQFIHSEAVKPTLRVLGSTKQYQGANSEFLKAHEHYRHKRYKECLVECLKSFESLMKAICEKNSWRYGKTDTAKKLINVCLTNELIPSYLQTQYSSIRTLLESGIPTVRNKEGGHGQGVDVSEVPEHLASYTLHLTASNLLFLVKCESNLSRKSK
ncbi:STM4504/CBY_0614 family protein [Endozoicomonas sp. ALC020]|uniref:STM4504/CBY_0614 family protein n=1 Tax=unclassified Endozoicomonas TaxID=2644528 RepID=UPI003BAEDF04